LVCIVHKCSTNKSGTEREVAEAMNESKFGHPGNEGPDPGSVRCRARLDQRPYWQRAHRDWRIWVALVSMPAPMKIYILSEDLAFLPHG
jgi:hypothetical protein